MAIESYEELMTQFEEQARANEAKIAEYRKTIEDKGLEEEFKKLQYGADKIEGLSKRGQDFEDMTRFVGTAREKGIELEKPDFDGFVFKEGTISRNGIRLYPYQLLAGDYNREQGENLVKEYETLHSYLGDNDKAKVTIDEMGNLNFPKGFDNFDLLKENFPEIGLALSETLYEQAAGADTLTKKADKIVNNFKKDVEKAVAQKLKEQKMEVKEMASYAGDTRLNRMAEGVKNGVVTLGSALGEQAKNLSEKTRNTIISLKGNVQKGFLELAEYKEGKNAAKETYRDLDKWEKDIGKMQYQLLNKKVIEKGSEEDKALTSMRMDIQQAKQAIVDKGWSKPTFMIVKEKVRHAKETWNGVKDKIFNKVKDAFRDVKDNLVKPMGKVLDDYAVSKAPDAMAKVKTGVRAAETKIRDLSSILTEHLMPKVIDTSTGKMYPVSVKPSVDAFMEKDDTVAQVNAVIARAQELGINPRMENTRDTKNINKD